MDSQNAMHMTSDAHPFGDLMLLQEAPPAAGAGGQQQGQPGQTGQPGADQQGLGPNQQQPPPGGGMGNILVLVVLMFGAMIVMQIFASRKEKKKREELLSSLKRHDRIQTVGGVIGTIAEIRDNEVVLKVDESNNTKIRLARSAVQQVLKSSSSSGASGEEQPEPEKVEG